MRTVLVFGTFDGIHLGHDNFFRQAKEHGDRLVAVIALDETVLQVKGRKPVRSEQERLQEVKAHPLIDEAQLGSSGNKYTVVLHVRPDVIALGYDQTHFTEKLAGFIKEQGLNTTIVRLQPYQPEKYKSSILRK